MASELKASVRKIEDCVDPGPPQDEILLSPKLKLLEKIEYDI